MLTTCATPLMPALLLPTAPTTPDTKVPCPLSSYGSPLVVPCTKFTPKMSSTMPAMSDGEVLTEMAPEPSLSQAMESRSRALSPEIP